PTFRQDEHRSGTGSSSEPAAGGIAAARDTLSRPRNTVCREDSKKSGNGERMPTVMRATRLLRIGLSPRFLHNVPPELGVGRRGIQYLVESIAHWVMSRDALIFMIPSIESGGLIRRGNLSV